MSFMDDFQDSQKDGDDGREAMKRLSAEAQAALPGLLDEIRSCFGPDPQAVGIQVAKAVFPVQDMGGNYQVPGLKVTLPGRKMITVKPEGLAYGGFKVDVIFTGCPDNTTHSLLHAKRSPEGDERVWAFLVRSHAGPELKIWSKEEFDAILSAQVLGKPRQAR